MAILELLLEELLPSARAALPFVQSMVEQGLSAGDIQAALSEAGLGVRRTDLLSLVRGLRGIEESRSYLESVRDDFRPDPSRLPAPIAGTLRSYSFQVRLSGRDADTGELRDERVTVSSSRLLTVRELKDMALSFIPDLAAGELGSGHLLGLENAQAVVETGTNQL
jgi:hypothetical protein